MDKEQMQWPLPQQSSPDDTTMPSRPSTPRAFSSQSQPPQDMRRPIVISAPTAIPSQSSWDVESLGPLPRKARIDRQRTPTPLLSRSFYGRSLSRSNSGASRGAQRTPDLYDGQSEESESLPPTPLPCRSPTPGLGLNSYEGPGRKSTDSYQEDPEVTREREQFTYQREIIYHHREDVPYMQSYSDMSLYNDYCTEEFLHKLMPPGSPTFYEYCGQPPTDILDIGSGRGYWAAEAATTWKWKNAHVTAFDIVDLGRPLRQALEPEISAHVFWVKGNFLKGLPFPSSSFGLVRLACLSLAMPMEYWHHLLVEVRRVLKPGGRVELIDDELFFPDIQQPASSLQRSGSLNMKPKRSSDVNSEGQGKSISRPSPLRRSPTSSGSKTYSRPSSPSPKPHSDFHTNDTAARDMETIFQTMLLRKYNVFPHPHQFLETLMINIFGNGRANCMFRADIVIPTSDACLERGKGKSILGTPRFLNRTPDSAGTRRPSLDSNESCSRSSGSTAPKAMRILSGTGSNSPRDPTARYQPSGFIVLPDTFVPCEPDMLEMHACKNIHVLLSCKHAIASYVQEQTNAVNQPLVTDYEFDELTCNYDHFKRTRFNWPEAYSGFNLDEEIPPSSATKQLFNRSDGSFFGRRRAPPPPTNVPYTLPMPPPTDEIIPIRTIRVYQGFRSGPGFDSVQLIPLPGRPEN